MMPTLRYGTGINGEHIKFDHDRMEDQYLRPDGMSELTHHVKHLADLIGRMGDHVDRQTSRILERLNDLETEVKARPIPVGEVEKPDLDMYKKKKDEPEGSVYIKTEGSSLTVKDLEEARDKVNASVGLPQDTFTFTNDKITTLLRENEQLASGKYQRMILGDFSV